jgi:hypothetical protein
MCGNNIHKECFNQWAQSKKREHVEVTCGTYHHRLNLTIVYCRAKWDDGKGISKGTENESEEGYMNLAKLAGMSSVRDTSTYHNWGWKKQRRY